MLRNGIVAALRNGIEEQRKQRRKRVLHEFSLDSTDCTLLELEKRGGSLEDIRKSAHTIQTARSKILERLRIARSALARQVTTFSYLSGRFDAHAGR